jgi:hypothetical protein
MARSSGMRVRPVKWRVRSSLKKSITSSATSGGRSIRLTVSAREAAAPGSCAAAGAAARSRAERAMRELRMVPPWMGS